MHLMFSLRIKEVIRLNGQVFLRITALYYYSLIYDIALLVSERPCIGTCHSICMARFQHTVYPLRVSTGPGFGLRLQLGHTQTHRL